ncbi:hypothetical protein Q7C_494 [Methylophaga frappieri]|uniref:Uncharacterized protein n=1 Tax=Methylophaga frappieri (strain ATCC BAA-2434 / DSM 25690 / JAM7) TaxID=754477 RepID=I1YFH4_METFJ|nr:hypothetical protein Q7C_494 [Methylophaga frappieri]
MSSGLFFFGYWGFICIHKNNFLEAPLSNQYKPRLILCLG